MICEEFFPEYYHRSLVGTIVDQNIFEYLVEEFLPELHQHFKANNTLISLVSQAWFLCLFIGYIPLEVALRTLDCIFSEGPTVLFQVALAILKLKQTAVLAAEEEEIVMILKSKIVDSEKLLEIAFQNFANLPIDKINELRKAHKSEAIKKIENSNKYKLIRDLEEKTRFNKTELELLYDIFHAVVTPPELTINFSQFAKIWHQILPELVHFGSALCQRTFQVFCHNASMELNHYISFLEILKKGTSEQKFTASCGLHIVDHGPIDRKSLHQILDIYLSLNGCTKDHMSPKDKVSFVRLVFDSIGVGPYDQFTFDDMKSAVLQKKVLEDWTHDKLSGLVGQPHSESNRAPTPISQN